MQWTRSRDVVQSQIEIQGRRGRPMMTALPSSSNLPCRRTADVDTPKISRPSFLSVQPSNATPEQHSQQRASPDDEPHRKQSSKLQAPELARRYCTHPVTCTWFIAIKHFSVSPQMPVGWWCGGCRTTCWTRTGCLPHPPPDTDRPQ